MKITKQTIPPLLKETTKENLEQIDDQDLKLLFQKAPMDVLLKPMKSNSRPYRKYIAQLGRLDRHSPNVKRKMLPFAAELYRKGDKQYRLILVAALHELLYQVEKGLEQLLSDKPADWKKLQGYNPATMADFLLRFRQFCQEHHAAVTLDQFWAALRLLEIPYPVGPQKKVALLLEKKEKEAAASRESSREEIVKEAAKPEGKEPEARQKEKNRGTRKK